MLFKEQWKYFELTPTPWINDLKCHCPDVGRLHVLWRKANIYFVNQPACVNSSLLVGRASKFKCGTSFKLEPDTIARHTMMRFIQVAVAVLSLFSVGRSAPVTSCESLIQPLEINGTEQVMQPHLTCHLSLTISISLLIELQTSIFSSLNRKKYLNVFFCHLVQLTETSSLLVSGQVDNSGRQHKQPRCQRADSEISRQHVDKIHCC